MTPSSSTVIANLNIRTESTVKAIECIIVELQKPIELKGSFVLFAVKRPQSLEVSKE